MGNFIHGDRSTGRVIMTAVYFWALAGFAGASTGPAKHHQSHYENAWVVVVFLALAGLEAWTFWTAWKNRLPEEEPGPEEAAQPHPPDSQQAVENPIRHAPEKVAK